MKQRQWKVRCHTIEHPDAQSQWDRSYQSLVQWSTVVLKERPSEPFPQEKQDESCHVCAGLYAASGTAARDDADAQHGKALLSGRCVQGQGETRLILRPPSENPAQ